MKLVGAFVLVLATCMTSQAQNLEPQVTEVVIQVPVAKVWDVFTTSEGYLKLGVAKAHIDLRVGGLMRTHYAPDGQLDDENSITNEILAFDPMKMLSIRIKKAPKTFPFLNAMKDTWSVIYFDAISPTQTKVTLKGLGYTADKESQEMRAFFERGNKWSLDELKKKLEAKPGPAN